MKYPQLVSPRAVNAISDWLVSRLEQLGVESPQIYTRLLLSLLQSSVQVNDPIEFSNLEAFFAQRKGGHKRFHLPSDTETLKKLNAVQCLREIVSNEQETATIEQLVDELCEKLKDIEKQTQNLSDEERFLIETHLNTDSLIQQQTQTSTTQVQQQANSSSSNNHHTRHHQQSHTQQQITQIYNNSNNSTLNSDSKRHHQHVVATTTTTTADSLNDLDNDPKKRYFRAFPALSKEMEDSFRIWRRNAKSLTWPVVGRSIVVDSNSNNINNNNSNTSASASLSSSSASSIISSSNFGANNNNNNNNNRSVSADKSVEKKLKGEQKVSATVGTAVDSSDVQQQQHQGAVAAAASVKKKSKRRRNQALCKGKTIQNIRKVSVGTNPNSIGVNKYHHYTHHRNSSPAWDTDFKGCWEMGPDLIKEFLSRQNAGGGGANKRNRSNSDSMDHEEHNVRKILNEIPAKEEKPLIMKPYIDLSFCCDDDDDAEYDHDDECQHQYTEEGVDYVDEDYDDNTLASVSELAMDSLNPNPKRLYQREGQGQKSNLDLETALEETNDLVDPLDFQQFKAKFNSSVEALWKNAEPTPTLSSQPTIDNTVKANNPLGGGISSAFYATLAPFKKDLWNFWSNYQQQNYDHQLNNKLSSTASSSSMFTNNTRLDDSSASSGAGADIANSSDYFSMPSNLDDFDKSVGGVRGAVMRTNEAGASLGAHTPSINVFLQNSIWSTSGDCVDAIGTNSVAADTDESFLYKVWHSNKKLSQLDVGNAANGEKMSSLQTDTDGGISDFNKSKDSSVSLTVNNQNLGANLQFPPYQSLKWSEGINAGPPYNCLLNQVQEMDSLRSDNNNLASYSSAANIAGATWEAPAYGHNAQPDLKSWCASNPMSLTEMYGNDVCDSIVNQEHDEEVADMAVGPAVTLPNHCANTSGFVAYSRIKQCGLVQPQTKPLQSSNATRLPKDFFRSGEEENLLNSERTHFHPIENFVDGHTFDISNALDTVEFERTSSGLLRYDSEEYLEYTRNDIYMADEEVATSNTNLLKYGRKSKEENKNDNFVIKFRVKRSGEIACQTEEQDFQLAAAKMVELPTAFPASQVEVTNMFNNTFSLSRQANNEAIMAAVTKAVAAAAKAAAENHLNAGHFNWTPGHNMHNIATVNSGNSMENNPIWMSDNAICDEVDFCAARAQQQQPQLTQNWSMQEVEKQCHQRRCMPQEQQQLLEQQQLDIKRKFPSNVEMERNEENSLDNNSLHTLWGMCAVCNSCEYGKSLPANRLLRDELQLEADEIMSDLRYMQDLYIGETTDILTDTVAGEMEDKMFNNIHNKEMAMDTMKNPWNCDVKESVVTDPMQVSMLQKVNQLIEDLLKPDNNGRLTQETEEYKEILKQTEMLNNWNLTAAVEETNTKNLWQFNDKEEDNNIWQHKPLKDNYEGPREKEGNATTTKTTNFMKPMKLLKQVGGSLSAETQYMETLNWEHDNLAKIWQQTTATTTSNITSNTQLEEEMFIRNKQNEMANNIIKQQLPQNKDKEEAEENKEIAAAKEEEENVKGTQKLVEEKNLKNLQNISALTPPSTLPGNSYKRMQNFLNNSAAKLKLAANRKRRHSASQNFYQQQQQQQQQLHYSSHNNNNNNNIQNNNNNNNNDNITDLNAYKQKLNETLKAAAKEQQQQQQQQLQEVTPYNSITNLEEQPTKQTIITCKYWTTATNGTQSSLDSAAAAMMLLAAATNANDIIPAHNYEQHHDEDVMLEENIFGNTFSCLIDKNASILKHVTMMTRPLTR